MELIVKNRIYSDPAQPDNTEETQDVQILLTLGMYDMLLNSIDSDFVISGDLSTKQQVIHGLLAHDIIEPCILLQGREIQHFYKVTPKGQLIAYEVQKSPRTIRVIETYRRTRDSRKVTGGDLE